MSDALRPDAPRFSDLLARTAAEHFGLSYLFPYQRLVISNTLEACGLFGSAAAEGAPKFQIALLPTGSGKTLCFTLPAVLLEGLTVVVFPLLALISDQQRRLRHDRIPCAALIGGQSREQRLALTRDLSSRRIKVLLTNPESLLTASGRAVLSGHHIDHLVFDEAHTVCEWGESFRPAYLEAGRIVETLQPSVLTAFTATAGEALVSRTAAILHPSVAPHIIRANPDRPNITYSVVPSIMKIHDLTALLHPNSEDSTHSSLPPVPRPAIIFCRSRKSAELTAAGLRRRLDNREIYFYHAGLLKEEKQRIEKWFFSSEEGILAATTAYGMGVDKSNIRTVIHRELSPSAEAFLQESGRAGRDGEISHSIVLLGPEEAQRLEHMRGSEESARFAALLSICAARHGCRREMLLRLLTGEPEACFGCDLCAGSTPSAAFGEETILRLLHVRPLRYTQESTARLLAGTQDHRTKLPDIPSAGWFGRLSTCTEEDIASALETLRGAGLVTVPQAGPWRGLLKTSGAGRSKLHIIRTDRVWRPVRETLRSA